MNRSRYIVGLLVAFTSTVYCQDAHFEIKGRIASITTLSNIDGAHLFISHTSIGTISNIDGRFNLIVPNELKNNKVSVSALGFAPLVLSLDSLLKETRQKSSVIILLTPVSYKLDELTVRSKPEKPKKIIKKAVKNLNRNYPHSFSSAGSYREFIEEDSTFVRALESTVTLYDPGYKPSPLKIFVQEFVRIDEIMVSKDHRKDKESFAKVNNLKTLLISNDLRYRRGPCNAVGLNRYSYQLDSLTYLGDQLVYVISAFSKDDQSKPTHVMWIREDNYAFVNIVFENTYNIQPISVSKNQPEFTPDNQYKSIRYTEINGKMYPYYIQNIYQTTTYDEAGEPLHTTKIYSELLLDKVTINNSEFIPEKERMNEFVDLDKQGYKYNPEFWNQHSTTMPTSAISERAYRELRQNK